MRLDWFRADNLLELLDEDCYGFCLHTRQIDKSDIAVKEFSSIVLLEVFDEHSEVINGASNGDEKRSWAIETGSQVWPMRDQGFDAASIGIAQSIVKWRTCATA